MSLRWSSVASTSPLRLPLLPPPRSAHGRTRIRTGDAAPRAWAGAIAAVEAEFGTIPDPYLRARAADVHAVGEQVARVLAGLPELHIDGEGVLIADELTPAQVAGLDTSSVRGLV